jgi:hypothetical protein
MRFTTVLLLVILGFVSSFGQYANQYQYQPFGIDSTQKLHSPRKALILALTMPGAGQIYNRAYVKAGIVWAGYAGLAYNFIVSRDSMKSYQTALFNRLDGDSTTTDLKYTFLTDNAVQRQRDNYRRRRDLSILGSILLYALQAIDANVDAHLMEFKVNKDLAIRPVGFYDPFLVTSNTFGIGLTYRIR